MAELNTLPAAGEAGQKKRCVIYARCSTRDQDTENQLAQLREYAARQDWAVAAEVVDVCSGGIWIFAYR